MVATPLRLMLIAGEPSGDVLGAELMRALELLSGRSIEAFGVGGAAMAAAGLQSLFPMTDLSVMGVAEVLPRLPQLQLRISQTVGQALRARPQMLITIDSPDFCFRVARQVRKYAPEIPIAHYVAPQIWAWRRGRARKIARYVDLVLALLPFEPGLFTAAGLACHFVGHPVVARTPCAQAGVNFRARHGIPPDAPLLAVLPGSRNGEVSRLLGPFGATIRRLSRDLPELQIFCATLPHVAGQVRAAVSGWPGRVIVTQDSTEKLAGFAACNAALAASGTVSLELAACGAPHVVAYKVSPLTAMIARRVLKISHVNLVNLILNESLIPELLQQECTPENLARELGRLLAPPHPSGAALKQRTGMHRALQELGLGQTPPSQRAAQEVLTLLARHTNAAG
ncbi:MAG: lipid-A-disaccharide synthase [Alphaproteobacteria bacterium]